MSGNQNNHLAMGPPPFRLATIATLPVNTQACMYRIASLIGQASPVVDTTNLKRAVRDWEISVNIPDGESTARETFRNEVVSIREEVEGIRTLVALPTDRAPPEDEVLKKITEVCTMIEKALVRGVIVSNEAFRYMRDLQESGRLVV